ncbi:hypothetical protein AURDEDRAFT_178258 [Auricularia subglabra TFB-10046 SS5]|uniref:Uncharacterized protein n=1 Tax=Auricularia subglabra (strain TFB-10046 / SS5) TaxID=717982 RepID=J0L8H1_AURST|nr:hypothetical protein AURDEDRAFT_178258 [Auricularia subglabra TFB-10046 SS5]
MTSDNDETTPLMSSNSSSSSGDVAPSPMTQGTVTGLSGLQRPRTQRSRKQVDHIYLPMDRIAPPPNETAQAAASRYADAALERLRAVEGMSTDAAFLESRAKVIFSLKALIRRWRHQKNELDAAMKELHIVKSELKQAKGDNEYLEDELNLAEDRIDALTSTLGKRKRAPLSLLVEEEKEQNNNNNNNKKKKEDEE